MPELGAYRLKLASGVEGCSAMATLVSFHAHPDDEAIACGGTLARAAADGHRVVLVFGTRGERGEVVEGFLRPGEHLWERRVAETHEAARILGVQRVEFLGYTDSGMMGEASNEDPACFWQAGVEEPAARLAGILEEEAADVVTIYDEIGGYGHPDHIQVHRVGVAATARAGTPVVYESTINKDYYRDLLQEWGEAPPDAVGDADFGVPDSVITTRVDVRPFLHLKRKAMAAHASQVADTSFFLAQPPDRFEALWSTEWFIRRGAAPDFRSAWLFEEGAG